ncbi:cryptochrome/photolyase family protein [Azospirillum sp.]|uniref:cryptochrome/photolyase family protein n=1 Tax=Azospirillum sp. TaxID=34012 RepID=UPI003D7579D8
MSRPIIVWFRRDLRLADNPALATAASGAGPVVPVFVLDDALPGAASRRWLHRSLEALAADLAPLGSPLVLRRGEPSAVLAELAVETGADAVLWNRRPDPAEDDADRRVAAALEASGVRGEGYDAALLFDPAAVRTKAGEPYRVFTPFWRACRALPEPYSPLGAPERLAAPPAPVRSDRLADWSLADGVDDGWTPGEAAARERLVDFLDGPVTRYAADRDIPSLDGTSRLSPHLHWGEIGPRQVWHAARHAADAHPERAPGIEAFLRELGWREFCQHQLRQCPDLAEKPLDRRFTAFPWREDPDLLAAWKHGRTGYPLVDAGMRQLLATGWMHNRVRMVVASFLVKDLLLPWQAGEAWFREALVDADPANNPANWQWVAGCGADAAPFFRVFNPVAQGEKFDLDGGYVRHWVPELADLPEEWIHKPWQAPGPVLAAAGVRLGVTYPRPVVDHGLARQRALAAFSAIRGN